MAFFSCCRFTNYSASMDIEYQYYLSLKARLVKTCDAETQTEPVLSFEEECAEAVLSPQRKRMRRMLQVVSDALAPASPVPPAASPVMPAPATPPSWRQRSPTATQEDPIVDSVSPLNVSPLPSMTSTHILREIGSALDFSPEATQPQDGMTWESRKAIAAERNKRMEDAIAFVISEREKGIEPFISKVCRDFDIPRTTFTRAITLKDKSIPQSKDGNPDRRNLRQALLAQYVKRHGVTYIEAQAKFKGVTTNDMLDGLSPESCTRIRPLMENGNRLQAEANMSRADMVAHCEAVLMA